LILFVVSYCEREKRDSWGLVVRESAMLGVKKTIVSVLKVPRQRPLVLLIGVRLVFRINSKFKF
jgi:hypothetical protein